MNHGPRHLVTSLALPDPLVVGVTIRNLRRCRHLTQVELGRRIGMRPGPMNNIEQGRGLPSTPVLCRIAAVLNVPVDVLLRPPDAGIGYVREATPDKALVVRDRSEEQSVYRVPPQRPDFSAPAAHPIHLLPADKPYPPPFLRSLEDVAQAFLALEDLCGVPKRAAIPLRLSMPRTEHGIEDLALRVRTLLGVGPAVIFDHLELLENAGLRIVFLRFPAPYESAACYDAGSDNAFLFVAADRRMSAERQLFRLACELGRIYCFTGQVTEVAGRDKPLDAEHVARKFAAFFLMPAEAVHATVRQTGVRYDGWNWDLLLRLKHRFGVSAETFLYRLHELDLIAPKPAADLKARITAHYAATHHAEPDGSRRILSPNGRLGDLLLVAAADPEAQTLRGTLRKHGVKFP